MQQNQLGLAPYVQADRTSLRPRAVTPNLSGTVWCFLSLHGSALRSESIIQPSQRLLGRRGEPGSAMGVQASGSEHQATNSEEINPRQVGYTHTPARSPCPDCLINNQPWHNEAWPCVTPTNRLNNSPTRCFHLVFQWAGNTQLLSSVSFGSLNGRYLRANCGLIPLESCRTRKRAVRPGSPHHECTLSRASSIHTTNINKFPLKIHFKIILYWQSSTGVFFFVCWRDWCIDTFRWKNRANF